MFIYSLIPAGRVLAPPTIHLCLHTGLRPNDLLLAWTVQIFFFFFPMVNENSTVATFFSYDSQFTNIVTGVLILLLDISVCNILFHFIWLLFLRVPDS